MIRLNPETVKLISKEMESIPREYHKPFNSNHEGFAVLLEEVEELKNEIFFGEKAVKKMFNKDDPFFKEDVANVHRQRIREEAVQIAAMACRIIQELT